MWAIVLLLLGVGFLVLEFFVPSGGVLSFLSVTAIVGSLIVSFAAGVQFGVIMLTVTAVVIPIILAMAIRWWPHTPIGRLVLIQRPDDPDDVLPETEEYRGLRQLIGKVGRAKSKMLPSGLVIIEGRSYDAVSDGFAIEPDQPIKVVGVRTQRILVRPAEGPVPEAAPAADAPADDVLSRPVESLGLEDLDEPLA